MRSLPICQNHQLVDGGWAVYEEKKKNNRKKDDIMEWCHIVAPHSVLYSTNSFRDPFQRPQRDHVIKQHGCHSEVLDTVLVL